MTAPNLPSYIRGITLATGNADTLDINVPAGVVDGDFLVMIIGNDFVLATCAGWTSVAGAGQSSFDTAFIVLQRTASSEPASYQVDTGGSTSTTIALIAFKGDQVSGWDVAPSIDTLQSLTNTTTPATVSISPTSSTPLLVSAYVTGEESSGLSGHTPPPGMVELVDDSFTSPGRGLFIASEELSGSGATGTRTATALGSATDYVTIAMALQYTPPAGPGGVYDLTNWKWQGPVEDPNDPGDLIEVEQPELASYSSNYLFLDAQDRMVLTAPVDGFTTGTGTRSEFREMEGGTEAGWNMATSGYRQLTVTGTFDVAVSGGSNPRDEGIIGQIHGPTGTPPLYLAIEYHVATPRVRIFKDGPGLANVLSGITPTSEVTYRIRVADGRVKLWTAFGGAENLAATPDFDWAAADFTEDTSVCYFKAGAYHKTDAASGATGDATTTISHFELSYTPDGGGEPDPDPEPPADPFIGQTSATGTSSSIVVDPPAGLASGDHQLIVALVGTSGSIPPTPSGFTNAGQFSGSGGESSMSIAAFIASSSTATGPITITNPAGGSDRICTVVRAAWRGGPGWLSNPAPASTTRSQSSSHALPSQATTAAGQRVVGVIAYDADTAANTVSFSMPSPWVERADVDANPSGHWERGQIAIYDVERTASGTQNGTVTATRSDVSWVFAATLDAAGSPPVVDAGADANIDQYDTFNRVATEDDGGAAITSRSWTVQSGPNQVGATLSTSATLAWKPTVGGSYVLRYTATNAIGSDSDDVTVTVAPLVFPVTATLYLDTSLVGTKHVAGAPDAPLTLDADPTGAKRAHAAPTAELALDASVVGKKINAVFAPLGLSASIQASSANGAFVTARLGLTAGLIDPSRETTGVELAAPLVLDAEAAVESERSGAVQADLALDADQTGQKQALASPTAPLAIGAAIADVLHETGIAPTAPLSLAAELTDPSRTTPPVPVQAVLRLLAETETSSVRFNQAVFATPLYLDAQVFTERIVAEVSAITPRADTTVRYDLVAVARVPQTSGPPTFIEVDPIDWTDLTWSEALNVPPTLSVSAKVASLTDSVLQRLQFPHEAPTELWLYRNGRKVFAGPLLGGRVSEESLSLEAGGIETYTRWMHVVSDLTFTEVDQFAIVAALINQWQMLEYGHFGIDLTTRIVQPPPPVQTGQAAYRAATADDERDWSHCRAARPSGTEAGDLLIAAHISDNDGSLGEMEGPDGWDLLGEYDHGSSETPRLKIWQRIATSSEPSSYEFPDSTDAHSALAILRITGHNPDAPLAVTPVFDGSSSSSNNHVAPSVTGVQGGLLVTIHAGETSGTTRSYWGAPDGMTARVDVAPSDGGQVVLGVNTQELTADGATGSRSAFCSGSVEWVAASLVIAPVPVAPPPPIVSGPTSGVLRTVSYPQAELHIVSDRIDDLAKLSDGLDWHIDPTTRRLEMNHPIRGVDRSVGEDAIVFDQRNITSSDIAFSISPADLASDGLAVATASGSDAPLVATYGNPELRSKFGRTGITASFQAADQATLNAGVQSLVNARDEVLLIPGPNARVTLDADLSAYDVGDTVSYHAHGRLTVSRPFRIRKRTVRVTETNAETVTIEFV